MRNQQYPSPVARIGVFGAAALALMLATGCGHRRVAYAPPPPPSVAGPRYARPNRQYRADEEFVRTHRPILTETGLASWYGPNYNHHRAADGAVYNQNQVSAANRTLPLGSLIKVTNVRTGQWAIMRVTDRGPFVKGRILDLSLAAAKETGIWLPGVAEVRMDVYSTPEPIGYGGRWCVQIGAFSRKRAALRLQSRLQRRYRGAYVIEFHGPTGYWVRINPAHDNRRLAVEIADRLRPSQGSAFLVRLD